MDSVITCRPTLRRSHVDGDGRGGPGRRRGGGCRHPGLYRLRIRPRSGAGDGSAVAVGSTCQAPLSGPPHNPSHEREGMAFHRPERLRPDTAGRLLGTVVGVVLLVLAPKGYLSIVTGRLILTVALGSFLKPTFEVNKRTRLAGGVSSGVVSTVAALGGTPLALVYQDRSGA